MRHSGFAISITPFAHEGGEDAPPAHHAQDYEGDYRNWCDANVKYHKEACLHYMALKDGDHKAAEEHGIEAARYQKQADMIRKAAERQGDNG
jgi:hypothetical protein